MHLFYLVVMINSIIWIWIKLEWGSDEKIEVIDPSDDRYKGDDYFNKNSSQNNQNLKTFNQTYSYGCTHSGCGCILGCLTISLISFLLSLLIFWII